MDRKGPIYFFKGNLYINLTNRCANKCEFCDPKHLSKIVGHNLILGEEPAWDYVAAELMKNAKHTEHKEIVFCGAGEPTSRYHDMLAIAHSYAANIDKKSRRPLRLDTNGLLFLIYEANEKDINIRLNDPTKLIDLILEAGIKGINVSLNVLGFEEDGEIDLRRTAVKYTKICRPNQKLLQVEPHIAFDYVLAFVYNCLDKKADVGVSFMDNYVKKADAEKFLKQTKLEGRVRLIMRHASNMPNIKDEKS